MEYGKGEKYMINQKKLYSIALVSTAMILMLTNITGAAPFAYITGWDGNVSVIDTSTNNVTAIIPLKDYYGGVEVAPDGTNVCVANNSNKGTVAVINTATNNVTATVNVKENPIAFEQFIAPIPINPTMIIATSVSSTSYNVAGQNIIYTYTVTNSENVDISGNITVTDNRTGQISIPNTNLAPGKALQEQLPM
jgi:YVTN family beta-propeller protein